MNWPLKVVTIRRLRWMQFVCLFVLWLARFVRSFVRSSICLFVVPEYSNESLGGCSIVAADVLSARMDASFFAVLFVAHGTFTCSYHFHTIIILYNHDHAETTTV